MTLTLRRVAISAVALLASGFLAAGPAEGSEPGSPEPPHQAPPGARTVQQGPGFKVQQVPTTVTSDRQVNNFKITGGWGLYFNALGAEYKTIASAAALGAEAACTYGNKATKYICEKVGFSAIATIAAIWKETNLDNGLCYQFKIIPQGNAVKLVDYSNCF